jgi:hypothetical protein
MTKPKLPPTGCESVRPPREGIGLADLGWPALSKANGERVTKLVRPKSSQRVDCLREAALTAAAPIARRMAVPK